MVNPDWDFILCQLEAFAVGRPLPSVSLIQRETGDPFAILLSTLVSLRTRDKVTLEVSRRMLSVHPRPADYIDLTTAEVEELLYPAAFYRNKAASLKSICEILVNQFEGKVPEDAHQLLALPGVGLKTANLVLSLAYDKPVVCVDTHVHRICNRCGWFATRTPEETTAELESSLPIKNRIRINELLVIWGQEICTPISPRCSICSLNQQCEQVDVTKKR